MKSILSTVSPAFASDSKSAPTLPCGAPHNLTFQIGGKPFAIDTNDFVAQRNSSTCVANVVDIPAPSNGSLFSWSLGQPFLRSNLVVFYCTISINSTGGVTRDTCILAGRFDRRAQ